MRKIYAYDLPNTDGIGTPITEVTALSEIPEHAAERDRSARRSARRRHAGARRRAEPRSRTDIGKAAAHVWPCFIDRAPPRSTPKVDAVPVGTLRQGEEARFRPKTAGDAALFQGARGLFHRAARFVV